MEDKHLPGRLDALSDLVDRLGQESILRAKLAELEVKGEIRRPGEVEINSQVQLAIDMLRNAFVSRSWKHTGYARLLGLMSEGRITSGDIRVLLFEVGKESGAGRGTSP